MAFRNLDAWLGIGLVVLGYYAALTVHKQLISIREASRITHNDQPLPALNQQTEDALTLDTLGQLAEHTNLEIRAASKNIIIERALQNDTVWRLMLRDIAGPNFERRDIALLSLRSLLSSFSAGANVRSGALVNSRATSKAIVDCLCNLLPEARIAESGHANEATVYRTQSERDALHILSLFLSDLSPELDEAGLVSRWLSKYPFGGPEASPSRKKQVMLGISTGSEAYEDDDFGHSMEKILIHVLNGTVFHEQMRNYNLIITQDFYSSKTRPVCHHYAVGPMQELWDRVPLAAVRVNGAWVVEGQEIPDDSDETGMVFASVPEGAVRTSDGYNQRRGDRPREESMEEVALRRRRREAMVLGVNGRPLQPADIIQRDPVTVREETEGME